MWQDLIETLLNADHIVPLNELKMPLLQKFLHFNDMPEVRRLLNQKSEI